LHSRLRRNAAGEFAARYCTAAIVVVVVGTAETDALVAAVAVVERTGHRGKPFAVVVDVVVVAVVAVVVVVVAVPHPLSLTIFRALALIAKESPSD